MPPSSLLSDSRVLPAVAVAAGFWPPSKGTHSIIVSSAQCYDGREDEGHACKAVNM